MPDTARPFETDRANGPIPGLLNSTPARNERICHVLEDIVYREFSQHPFSVGVTEENVEGLMAEYAAMSQAFPYIQAGALGRLYERNLESGEPMSPQAEVTSVVAGFLCWDEFGGHAKVLEGGNPALPKILNVSDFHANLLLDDCRRLFGKPIVPHISEVTRTYLTQLGAGLAASDVVERTAHMVAFEHHAGAMIEALWNSLEVLFDGDKDELSYFRTHVGGDDPAEAYHMAMTAQMVGLLVAPDEDGCFYEAFREAFSMNAVWCEAIKSVGGN